jgi:hypothetical protein
MAMGVGKKLKGNMRVSWKEINCGLMREGRAEGSNTRPIMENALAESFSQYLTSLLPRHPSFAAPST